MRDKGAHFHKCDFQAHTPRCWGNHGHERRDSARDFLDACRAKSLDAVAITDHHDLAFFSFIKEAAAKETDASGQTRSEVAMARRDRSH